MAEVLERSPKGPHVSFAHHVHLNTIPSTQAIQQNEGQIDPSTPPRTSNDLPTPPDSHVDVSHHTHPPTAQRSSSQPNEIDASTLQSDNLESSSLSAIDFDQSPSIEVYQRRAKRTSAGSNPNIKEGDEKVPEPSLSASTSNLASNVVSERQAVLNEAEERGRRRNRSTAHENIGEDAGSSRSRTPSPILGPVDSSEGRLSFAASFIPSAEEVRSLLYSPDGDKGVDMEEERFSIVNKDDVDGLLKRLTSMGLTNVVESNPSSDISREQELAIMVKKLINHSKQQDRYIDSVDKTLHKTRIRSISLLTSLQTTFAHTLASEYGLRARVEAELEGSRLQAKKLSVMLARSESRNEEIDRERAMSAEEEVLWQEEMKDHASAYAQQQAARARASQMAYAQAQGQKASNAGEGAKTEAMTADLESTSVKEVQATESPQLASGKVLEEPFEERRNGDEGLVTGLGISSGGGAADATLNLSPLSTIVKERNKLLSDKRHLKSRIRDVEAQRDRLEIELKNMRPLLVRGGASKNTAAANVGVSAINSSPSINMTPSTPGKAHKRDRSKRRKQATMGDAEAEHLLLAARRIKEINKFRTVDEEGKPRTPPPGVASSALPRTPKTPRTTTSTTSAITPKSTASRDLMESIHQSGVSSRLATNGSPLASRNTGPASLGRWGGHERTDSNVSAGGIDDLLHAAQTVLTPEKKASHQQSHSRSKSGVGAAISDEEDGVDADKTLTSKSGQNFTARDFAPLNESPKRRRVSTAGAELDRSRRSWDISSDRRGLAATFQGAGIRRSRISTEGAEPQASQNSALSALDLLADQAAASQHPSQSSDPSHSGEGEHVMEPDEFGSDYDDMAVDEGEEESNPRVSSNRPTEEGLIGSHLYPRGAYGHAYAQQSNVLPYDLYRSPNLSGYTYSSSQHTPINSQGSWSTPHALTNTPRNGMYGPGSNSSPPMNGSSRFSGPTSTFNSPHRLSTGTMNPSYHPSQMNQGHSDEGNNTHGNRQGDNRNMHKGGNTSPDKRLPYVRWSDEEDQKLKKAIQEHGQRWESVARVVGTRSYHQCRQRYLLMRRKEAAAREGNTSEDGRSTTHQVTAEAH